MNNLDEVSKEIKKFNEDRDWDQFHAPENLAKSIAIEAGELLECFQWNNNFDKQAVYEELADVVNYCILMADKLGVDLADITKEKMKKNAIKYPVEKAKGTSKKYNELDNKEDDKINKARELVTKVRKLAEEYNANFYFVTDGASAINNKENEAVEVARNAVAKWEREHGIDDEEDWRK